MGLRCLGCVHFGGIGRANGLVVVECDLGRCKFKGKREGTVVVYSDGLAGMVEGELSVLSVLVARGDVGGEESGAG